MTLEGLGVVRADHEEGEEGLKNVEASNGNFNYGGDGNVVYRCNCK